jgi:hypothetical protein
MTDQSDLWTSETVRRSIGPVPAGVVERCREAVAALLEKDNRAEQKQR